MGNVLTQSTQLSQSNDCHMSDIPSLSVTLCEHEFTIVNRDHTEILLLMSYTAYNRTRRRCQEAARVFLHPSSCRAYASSRSSLLPRLLAALSERHRLITPSMCVTCASCAHRTGEIDRLCRCATWLTLATQRPAFLRTIAKYVRLE